MNAKCGARTRSGGTCQNRAGFGTDHVGSGRCKFHGGATPIKHGRYSSIPRARLREHIEKLEQDPNPLNLVPDLQLARAMLLEVLEGRKKLDYNLIAELLERISRIGKRIHEMQEQKSISIETLQWIKSQMGLVVGEHVKDPDTLRAIESGWAAIVVKS